MALPDETSTYCSRCSVFNIGDDCCICKDCMNKIIDGIEWEKDFDGELRTISIPEFKVKLKQELALNK